MPLEIKIGLDAINSYRRLAYTPWHALAEFVDNSTQSYFDHRDELDETLQKEGEKLEVRIVYERQNDGMLRIADNAMGMTYEEIERAMHIGMPPQNTSGRSKYGLGLKTAASWIGNLWEIRTKRLGENIEHRILVDINSVIDGNPIVDYDSIPDREPSQHYTIIEITDHNRQFRGRTMGKIRDYLSSMYRQDFREGILDLYWQYFPKGMDLSDVHQNRLNAVARRLNERPRKTLNFRTPAERFSQCVASTG